MGELFNLLNEYITSKWWDEVKWYAQMYRFFFTEHLENIPEYVVISKEFWFIKWLVESNKIDESGVKAIFYDKDFYVHWQDITLEYLIIMYASIQDEPMKFLISILK